MVVTLSDAGPNAYFFRKKKPLFVIDGCDTVRHRDICSFALNTSHGKLRDLMLEQLLLPMLLVAGVGAVSIGGCGVVVVSVQILRQ